MSVTVDGKQVDYSRLPSHLQDGMRRWVEDGIQPGSFLSAVIENDLQFAVTAFDGDGGFELLKSIVLWLAWNSPSRCHGSRQTCKDWAEDHERVWR